MLTRLTDLPDIAPNDTLVVACLRNEALRLPFFLTHHRQLGVAHFLLIDNDSNDGSRDFLLSQPDVTLFHTTQSYAASNCGINWQNEVLNSFAVDHWTLILDIDEFFIFPGYETRKLSELIHYLEGVRANAMLAPMLDMYPDGPIAETIYHPGDSLLNCCPYFDAEGYTLGNPGTVSAGLPVRGGPRKRLFWNNQDLDYPAPFLQKFPLVRWRSEQMLTASTHLLEDVSVAPVTGLLLHFKMLQDFADLAHREAHRKEHFADARQYQAYHLTMETDPKTSAMCSHSTRFESSVQMQRLGLMKAPEDFPL